MQNQIQRFVKDEFWAQRPSNMASSQLSSRWALSPLPAALALDWLDSQRHSHHDEVAVRVDLISPSRAIMGRHGRSPCGPSALSCVRKQRLDGAALKPATYRALARLSSATEWTVFLRSSGSS